MTDENHMLNSQSSEIVALNAVRALWSNDSAAQSLGMVMKDVKPGFSRIEMRVRSDMLNGHSMCHGGLIFTLADTAFGIASNSHNRNTVGSACHIDYLAPAREGDMLVAEAVERSLGGRIGVYDVTVRSELGTIIALFRGKSYRLKGDVISDTSPEVDSNYTGMNKL